MAGRRVSLLHGTRREAGGSVSLEVIQRFEGMV